MVAVAIGEWHLRLTCGIIFATHVLFLAFVIWKRPYVHDFLNRMTICSTIEILIAYACAYIATVIDNPFSPASATIYTWCSLFVLALYLALEVVLFVSAAGGGHFAMAPDFGNRVVHNMVQVVCPADAKPGQRRVFVVNGQHLTVAIPYGAQPNKPFAIRLPAEGDEGEWASRDNAGAMVPAPLMMLGRPALGGTRAAVGVQPELEPEPEESLEDARKPRFRIHVKTACRAGKETNTPVTGSLLPGAIVTGLEEDTNSSGVRRIRTSKGWISHKPNILSEVNVPEPEPDQEEVETEQLTPVGLAIP